MVEGQSALGEEPAVSETKPRSRRTDTRLVDIETVALYLGVTVRHVRRLVAERRIPFVKWGRLLRFDVDAIDRWIGDHGVDPM